MYKGLLGILGATFLCGCVSASSPLAKNAAAGVRNNQSMAEEAAIASALQQLNASKASYAIAPGDLLGVSVFEQKQLDRDVRVGQSGTISFPLIGIVKIDGMSVNEAEGVIGDKLRDFLVNPQVTLFVKQYRKEKIFILGEVGKPGSVDLPDETKLTVLEAITLAGGFSKIAAPNRTKVIRMVNGKTHTIPVEVSAIMYHGQKEKDFALHPNDVIYVPQSYF